MMTRAILTVTILIALTQTATAGVPLFGHVSCAVVRFYVAKYSEAAAERWARSQGASNADIEAARGCLHSTVVQTASASSVAKPKVPAPVSAEEPAKHERDELDSNREVQSEPVQGQRAKPEQDKHGNELAAHDVIRAKYTEDRSANGAGHETKDLPPAARKATILHRYVRAMYHTDRAGVTIHLSWLKRMWDHLTRRRQFSIAFLHFKGGRR
jgi:hypothetical protein